MKAGSTSGVPDDLVAVADAGKRIGMSVDTIRRYVRHGHLRGWKIGPTRWGIKRRTYVSMAELLTVLVEVVIPRPPK
jgi:hypothetical protein